MEMICKFLSASRILTEFWQNLEKFRQISAYKCNYWAFHLILLTSILVDFGNKVTKTLRNSLFIFHFALPSCLANEKHYAEKKIKQPKRQKNKNEVTKICDEPSICTYHITQYYPPVDLHWFFEISIRTEKKIS